MKNKQQQSTTSILLYFNASPMPTSLTLGNITFPISAFRPKTQQCGKCQKFGHNTENCRAEKNTCGNCAGNHKTLDGKHTEKKCANCDGKHSATNNACVIKTVTDLKRSFSDVVQNKTDIVVATPVYNVTEQTLTELLVSTMLIARDTAQSDEEAMYEIRSIYAHQSAN